MPESSYVYEYDAALLPYRGLASQQDASRLGPGWLKEAQNVVYADDGVLRSALGTTEVWDAGSLPAGTVLGLTKEPLKWGTNAVALMALAPDSAPTTVDVYYRKYDTSTDTLDASWTKCTADSGKYGDTKGQVPTYGSVQFQPITDSSGIVGCLVQFGVRNENVLLVNFGQSFTAIPVLAIQPPEWADASTAEAGMSDWIDVVAGAMKTSWSTNGIANHHYNTGGTFDVAGDGELNLSTAGGNGREWRLLTGTGATYAPAVGDFGWHQLNTAVDFSAGRQTVMLFASGSSESYFSNFQIALTKQADSGTTDGDATDKLVDAGQNFLTTVEVGDVVLNVTDNTSTTVTAVDSDSQLTLDDDIFDTAEAYVIVRKFVIHDPAAEVPINERQEITVESTASVRMAVFPNPADKDLSEIDGVMWTVADTTNIPDNASFRLLWVACGGVVPGTAQYAVGFYSSTSKTDSPGVLLRDVLASENASTLIGVNTNRDPDIEYFVSVRAGVAGGAVPPEFYMPIDRRVYYQYRVPTFAPVSETVNGVASASSGWADKYSIYRKDPGEGAFYHVVDKTVASWSGSAWQTDSTLFGGTSEWKKKAYTNDTVGIGDKDFNRKVPDAFVEPVPVGQAMMASGKRLFVGAFRGEGSANTAQMSVAKVSESDQPFRFREFQREVNSETDVDSGYAVALGHEDIRAFFDVSASNIGSPATYCLTDKRLVQLAGPVPIGIASVGTIAPGSVTEKDGRTFFIDSENRVRLMDAVTTEVAEGFVGDVLDSVPAAVRQDAVAISFKDRVLFALSETGSTANIRLLVWSWKLDHGEPGGWEQNGKYPSTKCPQFFMLWNVDGESKVYFMASDRKVYQLDSGEDHAGTDIDGAWRCADRSPIDPSHSKTVERAGMVFDDATGLTVTVTKTGNKDTSLTQSGTIDMDVSTARGKKLETGSTQEIPSVEDSSVKVRYTFTKTSAKGRMAVRAIALQESETENDDFGA